MPASESSDTVWMPPPPEWIIGRSWTEDERTTYHADENCPVIEASDEPFSVLELPARDERVALATPCPECVGDGAADVPEVV